MEKFLSTKSVLIFLGILTILLTGIAMFNGNSTDGWWGILMGASIVAIAFSLGGESKEQ
ncbi:MAG: hypothetical protein AAF633_19740 [Chloroflexota bacterium]